MLDQSSHPTNGSRSWASRGPTTDDPTLARSLHTVAVVTPEAVLLEFRAAGIASRLLAKGIDLIIQFVALVGVVIAGAFLTFLNETAALIATLVSVFLVIFAYPTIEAAWGGQTLGKKVFGIKVITTEGGPVQFRHAAIRSLVWFVEFLFPPGGLLALTAALMTRQSQRLGDLAAGTVVIRSAKPKSSPVFFAPAAGAEHFSSLFDAGRMHAHDYALVREFLVRAHELSPDARTHVASRLAEGIEASSGLPRPPTVNAERYLVSAVFAYQKRFAPAARTGPSAPPPRVPPPPPRIVPGPGAQIA